MFVFTKSSNIIRIRYTAKITFKMPKQGRHSDKGSPHYNAILVYLVFLACYLPFLPSTILYMTNTSVISFIVANSASISLICLNSSLNPLVYCWRYREIRQSVKSTVRNMRNDLKLRIVWIESLSSVFCEVCKTKYGKETNGLILVQRKWEMWNETEYSVRNWNWCW